MREMGRSGDFEPAIVASRDRDRDFVSARQVCAVAQWKVLDVWSRGGREEKEMEHLLPWMNACEVLVKQKLIGEGSRM